MTFRKLRIAWSVFWGLACILVLLLWDRGLERQHYIFSQLGYRHSEYISSHENNLELRTVNLNPRSDYVAKLPFSWFVLVSLAFTIAPWIRWHFNLRTLLIATTLVAVVLGLAVYAATS